MKYSTEELKAMALRLLDAKASGDLRYLEFMMTVSMQTGVDPRGVEGMIQHYARGRTP